MIIIMVTTTDALVLAGVGIVAADSLLFAQYLKRDLSALARIVADNSTAALAFNDPRVGRGQAGRIACADSSGGSVYLQAGRHRLRQILAPGVPLRMPLGRRPG